MKFSERWLREFVDPVLTTRQLLDDLTMVGLEADGYEPVAAKFARVVIGEIVQCEAHPNADKLAVCQVSDGTENKQVVCGAPNVRVGLKAPFALVGAKLADLKIKKAKLRGIESHGMLCSGKELGISEQHDGLLELPQDAPVGDDIRRYMQLDDVMIDIDLTPNRGDCLGMIGLARETGLSTRLDCNELAVDPVAAVIPDTFPVELADPHACPKFVGRIIRGINVNAQTPLWMQEKLRRSDVRSIDPVVDVTNYVMLELGQPLHAYDLATLTDKIIVRQSVKHEEIKLLDGQKIKLNDETLLITDAKGPIGVAGIMGGLSTAVSEITADIFLESAFFSPSAIVGRARAYGLSSEAAYRFERGVDWQGQIKAIERATRLLVVISGGQPGPVIETKRAEYLPQTPEVKLRLTQIKKLLGVEIHSDQVTETLVRLGFKQQSTGTEKDRIWTVMIPSHRFDIILEEDLIEEVGRVYGYNNLPVKTPKASLQMAPIIEAKLTVNHLKDQLVSRGYHEIITYSFVDSAMQTLLDPQNAPLELANPLSSELAVMRTTLWSGLLKILVHNLHRQQTRIRLFETGLRFLIPKCQVKVKMANIAQEMMIAGIACGSINPEGWTNNQQMIDFYDIKGDVESLLNLSGQPNLTFKTAYHPALHSGQTAIVMRDGELLGYLGRLNPNIQKTFSIQPDTYLFELKVSALLTKRLPNACRLSKFPEVRRDIAVVVDQAVNAAAIKACIESVATETLKNLKLFDVYQGKGIDLNRKSIALGLQFQHTSRTLKDDEINAFVNDIVKALTDNLGANLRD